MTRAFAATVGALIYATASCQAASLLAFSNSPSSDKFVAVAEKGPTLIVGVALSLKEASNVLVQFTSGATAETSNGCPCSVRAFLRADGGELTPVKRVNLGSPSVIDQLKYAHDRQNIDGSFVFEAELGEHKYELFVQQVSGTSTDLRIYYPNVQAIAFPK